MIDSALTHGLDLVGKFRAAMSCLTSKLHNANHINAYLIKTTLTLLSELDWNGWLTLRKKKQLSIYR